MSVKYPLLFSLTIILSCQVFSVRAQDCLPEQQVGSFCELSLDKIRPTQFSVGEVAVACKASKISEKSGKKLKEYLENKKRLVPAVIGPDGKFYITDHHHLAAALYKASNADWEKNAKRLRLEIIESYYLRKLSSAEFWALMQQNQRSYNVDNKGMANMNFALLPHHVSGLLNDPYRTLSRWVRESCGYVKAGQDQCDSIRTDHKHQAPYFMEFYWGNFFRQHLPLQLETAEICQSLPYSGVCLKNEIKQLKALYPKAMLLAASAEAQLYFTDLKLDPWEYGYNPEGEQIELDWSGYGQSCEDAVND